MTTPRRTKPDYWRLKAILERLYGREVSHDEAKGTGDFLINVYEVLLSDGINSVKIESDTTNR